MHRVSASIVVLVLIHVFATVSCTDDPTSSEAVTDVGLTPEPELDASLELDVPVVEPDVTPVVDVDTADADSGATPPEYGLCKLGEPAPVVAATGSNPGAVSPWTGSDQNNLVLGPLEESSALVPTTAVYKPDYGVDLSSATFDVHVPEGYDGSEAWGLIVFINAGDGGGMPPAALRPLLAEHKLLWVAPDNVGNSIQSVIRMGWAHMAVLRMRELLNVNPNRVHAMGRSGGARHANLLAFMHPETYRGVLAFCGAHYFRQVEQAFETHQLDSHYEFWDPNFIPATVEPFAEHLAQFDQRFSLMTADGDFREGDLLNIYHFGYLADGLPVRLFDTAGGHCQESAEQMRSGLAFAEHPLHPVIADSFADGEPQANTDAGDGWVTLEGQATEQDGALVLTESVVMAANRFVWADRFGVTLRTTLTLEGSAAEARASIEPAPTDGISDGVGPAMLVRLTTRDDGQLGISLEARTDGKTVSLLSGVSSEAAAPMGVVIHAWDHQLHLVLDRPLASDFVATAGVKVLRDGRTIIVRWESAGVTWGPWPDASILTFAALTGTVRVGPVQLKDGVGLSCP